MASTGRTANDDLKQVLLARPWEFEFAQAVSLLQQAVSPNVAVGEGAPFREEMIRFAPSPRLAPSAAEVRRIDRTLGGDNDAERFRVIVTFMGLYGAAGPGPAYLLEAAAGTVGDEDTGSVLRDFLDLFNSRLTAMHYRACLKHRWHKRFRRGATDLISGSVFALLGLRTLWERTRLGEQGPAGVPPSLDPIVPRARLLRYAGAFTHRVRCPANLRGILWDYFDGPDHRFDDFVEIEEFVPQWLPVDAERCCTLGLMNRRVACHSEIDDRLIVGRRVRDAMSGFRVVLGPLVLERFRQFLPIGKDFAALVALIELYRPDQLGFRIRLRLQSDELPPLVIGKDSRERLGWSTWLGSPGVIRHQEGVVQLHSRSVRWSQAQAKEI